MSKRLIVLAVLASVSSAAALAKDKGAEPALSISSLDMLVGEWALSIAYANGATATGTRICTPALGDVYIRCDTSVTFGDDDKTARKSISYINFNSRRGVFEDVAMWQFPPAKKIMDVRGDPQSGEMSARGYIYSGEASPARRIMETWSINKNKITMTVKSNLVSQRADEWPVFFTETMMK
ncbi:hypothetical protein MNBD_ALPHA05-2342 [hydrothermal vent metagenome]|uniref:DUF1579 domain-containing protein n=1 Tax=hydrothermal vent metagenome TaxID=652676 RepID=A0A3B0S5D0_9ZZZZ